MYYISRTAAMIISLHVFEDDTVAKVTVSKANLDAFFSVCWALPRSLLLRYFVLRRNANLAGGFAGRFWWFCCFLFGFVFVMICQSFWTTGVLVHYCFSLLTQL